MKRPSIGFSIGCLVILVLGMQFFGVKPARAETPPALTWHVAPGDELVYLYVYDSYTVGSLQSYYFKYQIVEINNTVFDGNYYRDVVWGHMYVWSSGHWVDGTGGQVIALLTANHTWQAFSTFVATIPSFYSEVIGYPRGRLQTNASGVEMPSDIILPEMPHGGGLYNMSQYNQSYFVYNNLRKPGAYDPQYSSFSETENWWRFDNGTYLESLKWNGNGILTEMTLRVLGAFPGEMNFYLIDAPGYHRNYLTSAFGLPTSNQWGVIRDQQFIWKNNTSGNYLRFRIDGFQNCSMPGIEALFATQGTFDTATSKWTSQLGPLIVAGCNLTSRTFSTTWGTVYGQSTHFLGGPQFATSWENVYSVVWIIPLPLNLTRLNETYCYVTQGHDGQDSDLTSALAVVDGQSLTITNNSVNIASWTYTSQGVMQSYVERNWTDGSVIYNFTHVETLPGIALETSTGTKIPIGGSIPLTITDTNGEGLATVKYLFDTSTVPPTTWDQAISLSAPWTVVMPDGTPGVLYLHVLAEDALGMQVIQSFTLERLAGNVEPGIPGYWIIGIVMAAIAAIGITIFTNRRKIHESLS